MPREFAKYLSGIQDWHENLENFRHALAHRMPPYIPPGFLTRDQTNEYENIQMQINEALLEKNYETTEKLEHEQADLLSFHPIETHSFSENSPLVYFHSQMLIDIDTVMGFAFQILREFDEQNTTHQDML
ncbi:MAG: hypothetical protein F4X92_05735 [Gammaproteobacteria bacterium]|nr:hypothetical protein [Gammaproteobacteria bacterium]